MLCFSHTELEELERLGQKAFKKFPSTGGGLPQAEDMKSPRMLGSGPWPGIELVRGQYTVTTSQPLEHPSAHVR